MCLSLYKCFIENVKYKCVSMESLLDMCRNTFTGIEMLSVAIHAPQQ